MAPEKKSGYNTNQPVRTNESNSLEIVAVTKKTIAVGVHSPVRLDTSPPGIEAGDEKIEVIDIGGKVRRPCSLNPIGNEPWSFVSAEFRVPNELRILFELEPIGDQCTPFFTELD